MDIINTLNLLMEALNPKQMRFIDDISDTESPLPSDTHDKLFAKYNDGNEKAERLIIPVTGNADEDAEQFNKDIAKHLHENGGWTIHDYKAGIATRKLTTKKGFVKTEEKSIGALLKDTGGENHMVDVTREKSVRHENGQLERKHVTEKMSLTQAFNTDPIRQNTKSDTNNHQIVISRNKYDIGGMTSGRPWQDTSCMRLPHSYDESDGGGVYHHKIKDDFGNRTLVAYLTHKGDDLAETPLGRVLLKRFTNEYGHDTWRPESKAYGQSPDSFMHSVNQFARSEMPIQENTEYIKNDNLYDDDGLNSISKESIINVGPHKKFISSRRPVEIISEQKNEHGVYHTDNDAPSLHIRQTIPSLISTKEVKIWHKNGVVHNNEKPSLIVEHNINGYTVRSELIHHNGLLHSPKNGKVPSLVETKTNNQTGEIVGRDEEYHKFGKKHNSTIHGLSGVGITDNTLFAKKELYGTQHTDDEHPSQYTLSADGTETKHWSEHGHTVKFEHKGDHDYSRYEYNGTPFKREGMQQLPNGKYIHPIIKPNIDEDGKIWLIKKHDGETTPKHFYIDGNRAINHEFYIDHNGKEFTQSKVNLAKINGVWYKHDNGGEPAILEKQSMYGNRVTTIHHMAFNQHHHEIEPAHVQITHEGKKLHQLVEHGHYNGSMNVNDLPDNMVYGHEWHTGQTYHDLSQKVKGFNNNGEKSSIVKHIQYVGNKPLDHKNGVIDYTNASKIHQVVFNTEGNVPEKDRPKYSLLTDESVEYHNGDRINKSLRFDDVSSKKYKIGHGLTATRTYPDGSVIAIRPRNGMIHVTTYSDDGYTPIMRHKFTDKYKLESETVFNKDGTTAEYNPTTGEYKIPEGFENHRENIISKNIFKEFDEHFKPHRHMFNVKKRLIDENL